MKGGPGAAQPVAINARVTATMPKRLSMFFSFGVDQGLPMKRNANRGAVQPELGPLRVGQLVADVARALRFIGCILSSSLVSVRDLGSRGARIAFTRPVIGTDDDVVRILAATRNRYRVFGARH